MPKRFCATWPITMFVLSPSVATTTASASSIPASRRRSASIPWPTTKRAGPVLAEPRERVLVLVDDRHVPALLEELERDRRADPAAADDQCLHDLTQRSAGPTPSRTPCGNATISTSRPRRLAQDVVDGRREEARLPAPARRRAEHDQVGPALRGRLDDRVADRARPHRPPVHLDAVVGAERARLRERRGRLLLLRRRARRRAAWSSGTLIT